MSDKLMTHAELKQLRVDSEREKHDFYAGAGCQTALRLLDEIEARDALLKRIDPYLDSIVCYASTVGEHQANLLVRDVREAIGTA